MVATGGRWSDVATDGDLAAFVLLTDDDVVSGEADEAGPGAGLLEDRDGVAAERRGDERGRADPAVALEGDTHALMAGLADRDGGPVAVLVVVAYSVGSTV